MLDDRPTFDKPATPLFERDDELRALAAAVAAVAEGDGRVVLIEAPAGMGKTRLLDVAERLAEVEGMLILRGRGAILERDYAYGVVRQLFADVVERGGRALFAGAAELSLPLFDDAACDPAAMTGSSFALLHGLFWLATNVAAARPVAVVVDDVHWADAPSVRFLEHLARRLDGLPVAVILGFRPDEAAAAAGDALVELTSDPRALVLRPRRLSRDAVAALLRAQFDAEPDADFVEACAAASRGNPLELGELAAFLAAEAVPPVAASVPVVEDVGARALSRSVEQRLARLPAAAVRVAEAAAVLGDDAAVEHAARLCGLDEPDSLGAVAELASAGLVERSAPIRFAHLLLRMAVYQRLDEGRRHGLHLAAARLLLGVDAEPETVAAQVLLLPPQDDPALLAVLREAAARSMRQGAADIAVAYLRRALRETDRGSAAHAAVLAELGQAETFTNGRDAVEHLSAALEAAHGAAERAPLAVMLVQALMFTNRSAEAVAVAEREIDRVRDHATAGRLEALLVNAAMMVPALYPRARRRFDALGPERFDGSLGARMMLGLHAFERARSDATRAEAVGLARRALSGGVLLAEDNGNGPYILAGLVLAVAEEPDSMDVWAAGAAAGRRAGSIFAIGASTVFSALDHLLRGELSDAEADAEDAITACAEWGIDLGLPYPIAYLGRALVEQGRLDEAEAVLGRLGIPDFAPFSSHLMWFVDARLRWLLAAGHDALALDVALAAGEGLASLSASNPAFVPWRGHAAAALVGLGDRDRAEELAREEVGLAERWGAPGAVGRSLRTLASTSRSDDERVARLRASVSFLERSPARLEHARSLAALGGALARRPADRAEAVRTLERASALAARCGANPVRSQAGAALAGLGETTPPVTLAGLYALTARERRAAELAAGDMSDRAIAEALLLPEARVAAYVRAACRKLGVQGRAGLAAALAAAAG